MVCFSFSIAALAPMMLSSELRVAASRLKAKFWRLSVTFSRARLIASLISSTSPGLLADVVGRAAGLHRLHRGFVVVDRGNQDDRGFWRDLVRVRSTSMPSVFGILMSVTITS